LGAPGEVESVAISPDERRVSFVLRDAAGEPENSISVVEVASSTAHTFALVAPAQDAQSVATIRFADAMDFTADGQTLIYDALNAIQLVDGSTVENWSIYALNLTTQRTLTIVPPTPGTDYGFPALSHSTDNFVTFDAFDAATQQSTIVAANLNTGDVGTLATVDGFGAPVYTGDDNAIIFTQSDASAASGSSLTIQRLQNDHITPSGAPARWLTDASFAAMYRRATPPDRNGHPDGDGDGAPDSPRPAPPTTGSGAPARSAAPCGAGMIALFPFGLIAFSFRSGRSRV
jgi:hypothetical protein